MYGIDKKLEADKNHTVLFYNMGGMDTEVTIARYSMLNVSEKKSSPHIEILAEAWSKELGVNEIDIVLVNLLAERFNALKEREGKPDVRENVRATKRLQKEVVKIKEVLSANKQASVKIPELLDYVTLQLILHREELEEAAKSFFAGVAEPVTRVLAKAGLEIADIDQV